MTGVYISGHPLDDYADLVAENTVRASELAVENEEQMAEGGQNGQNDSIADGTPVRFAGLVSEGQDEDHQVLFHDGVRSDGGLHRHGRSDRLPEDLSAVFHAAFRGQCAARCRAHHQTGGRGREDHRRFVCAPGRAGGRAEKAVSLHSFGNAGGHARTRESRTEEVRGGIPVNVYFEQTKQNYRMAKEFSVRFCPELSQELLTIFTQDSVKWIKN